MIYNIILFTTWIIFIGDISAPHLLLGVSLVIGVRLVTYYININIANPFNIKFLLYIPWLIKEIWCSAISVVKIILHPKMPMAPAFETIQTIQTTNAGSVLYANSITLTPGTYTIDTGQGELLVHSLVKQDKWPDIMDRKIAEVIKC